MEISNRLKTIAGMVSHNSVACDVGTDHGYLAIYLVKHGICKKVIAMDVAKGPLSKAQNNIRAYNCDAFVETRLSDGLEKLNPGEADAVIMAGMGGILINTLLEKGVEVLENVNELILSPHTDVELVRRHLLGNGYLIEEEKMLVDEEKYYVVMKAVHGQDSSYDTCQYRYGKLLLQNKDSVLKDFLQLELKKMSMIRTKIQETNTESANKRKAELEQEIQCVLKGLKYYEV